MAVIKVNLHLPHNDKLTALLEYPLLLFLKDAQVLTYHIIFLREHHHCISPLLANLFIL